MDYYFYIEPYSLFFRKKDQCLLYNTLNKKALKINLSNDILTLADHLETDKYIVLSADTIKMRAVYTFVNQLRKTFNGDLLPASSNSTPPAVLAPIINNQREFEKLSSFEWMEKDGQVLNYIEELYLYLNGCKAEPDDNIWKQYPSYFCSEQTMDSKKLIDWLKDCPDKHISRINLLGGDVQMYSDMRKIWNVLQKKSAVIQIYYRYDLFTEAHQSFFNEEISQLVFIVPTWNIDNKYFTTLVNLVEHLKSEAHFLFLISSETEMNLAETLIKKYTLRHQRIKPIY